MTESKSDGPGIGSDCGAAADVRAALVRAIIEAGSEGTRLDSEDRDVLERYGTGKISWAQMMHFFNQKAARIDGQLRRPQ